MDLQNNQLLHKCIDKWGLESQLRMMREECIELSLEIGKFLERDSTKERESKMISEMADVKILSAQMDIIYGDAIDKQVEYKMNRLKERV